MKVYRLHRNLAAGIRFLGFNAREISETFQISLAQAKKVLEGKQILLEPQQIDIVQSVLRNQISYALSARIERLLNNPKTRKSFVLWVHSAACMLDIYEAMQVSEDQCDFINPMDPILAGLYTIDIGMKETRHLLTQIHQKCPQFDELFFHGTRLLETFRSIPHDVVQSRVPTSLDVLTLSPEDVKIRENLLKEQQ